MPSIPEGRGEVLLSDKIKTLRALLSVGSHGQLRKASFSPDSGGEGGREVGLLSKLQKLKTFQNVHSICLNVYYNTLKNVFYVCERVKSKVLK